MVTMTRTELVKKLASYVGVDEAYSASFMESFLLMLHKKLLENESFSLPINITFTQKKIVRNGEEIFLISCRATESYETQNDELVFAVPSVSNERKSDRYSVFSISIGKQIIPSKAMVESGFAFEPSFSLKNYYKTKADMLVRRGDFQSKEFETETLDWNFSSPEKETTFEKDSAVDEDISKEIQDFSWDFGKDWKRELQEDALLSVEPSLDDVVEHKIPDEEKVQEKENSFWDFEPEESEKTKTETRIDEVDFSKLHQKLGVEEEPEEYQEVVSNKTREISIDLSEFDKIIEKATRVDEPDIPLEEETSSPPPENAISDNDFVHVKSTSEFMLTQEQEALLAENDPFTMFTREAEAIVQHHEIDEMPPSPFSEEEIDESPLPDFSNLSAPPEEEDEEEAEEPKKSGKVWTFISGFLMLIIFLFLYWKMWGIPEWIQPKQKPELTAKRTPAVIEREYTVPVSFPYEIKVSEPPTVDTKKPDDKAANQASTQQGNDASKKNGPTLASTEMDASDIFSKNNPYNKMGKQKGETSKPVTPSKPEKTDEKVSQKNSEQQVKTAPAVKSTLVRDNIYLEGSKYVVQLSSWKSESIADQEVARLKRKGLNAFKSAAVVPQKGGTWYRVKVGGFSSEQEAYRFYKSLK